jgi:anti-sigma factor RsiW
MSSHHQSDSGLSDHHLVDRSPHLEGDTTQISSDLDVIKRDRFELLSAYLDGEVSPSDRRLVSTWLTDDPETQCLYRRLLYLRQGFSTLCQAPASEQSCEKLTDRVYQRLNQGVQRTCMASFAAVALAVFGVFSGTISNRLWGVGILQGTAPSMGQTALDTGTSAATTAPPPIAVAAESRMETWVEQNSESNSMDMGSEL